MKPSVQNQKLRLGLIYVIMLSDVFGASLFYPIAPYIVRQYSADALAVTMMTVLFSAAQFIAAPILGRLSDRYGRRPVLLITLLGSALGFLIFGLSGSLWMLFLSRVIDGFAGGNMSTASAYIADISTPEERPRNFTLIGLAWGVGLIAGPALGTVLAQVGLMLPAFFATALMGVSFGLSYFFLSEALPPQARNTDKMTLAALNPLGSIWSLLRRPVVGRLLLVACFFSLAANGMSSINSLYMIDRFAAPAWIVGGYLVVIGVGIILLQTIVPLVVRRLGQRGTVGATLVQQAAGSVAIYLMPSLWSFLPVSILNGWFTNFIYAPMTALQTNSVGESDVGMLMGVTTSLNSLMNIFGPLLAGFVYDAIHPGAPYLAASVSFLLGGILLLQKGSAALWSRAFSRQRPTADSE